MNVMINGQNTSIGSPCSVAELLAQRGLGQGPCAVEVNEQLVPRSAHDEHMVCDGDRIEIVTLVGGG